MDIVQENTWLKFFWRILLWLSFILPQSTLQGFTSTILLSLTLPYRNTAFPFLWFNNIIYNSILRIFFKRPSHWPILYIVGMYVLISLFLGVAYRKWFFRWIIFIFCKPFRFVADTQTPIYTTLLLTTSLVEGN